MADCGHPANIDRADAKRKGIFNRQPHGYRYCPQVFHDVALPSALTSALVRKRRLAGQWGRTALSHFSSLLLSPVEASGEDEWMSEVGERETGAECRLVGLS